MANQKKHLKECFVLNEHTWSLEPIASMLYERDAHGVCSWRERFVICVGSWHGNGSRTSEMYDCETDSWHLLPRLNEASCAPGLCTIGDKLYKLGGQSDISKVEVLDLRARDRWVILNTVNKFGQKQTINRCMLFPLSE